VKHLDEDQAEALLEWLELREDREALRKKLDGEIETGLQQLRSGQSVAADGVHAEIAERGRKRRTGRNG
jgi:hypothetical protein